MSRCRAESFYVAPGQYRSFEQWAMYTRHRGKWVQVTHRKDVERLSRLDDWDGLCYVTRRSADGQLSCGAAGIVEAIATSPEDVEMWQLDGRLINGKRSGSSHHLHTIARNGTAQAGGTRESVGALLGVTPASKSVVRWFVEQPPGPTVEAAALKLLTSARGVLDEDSMQSLAARMRKLTFPVPMPLFDTAVIGNLHFLERYDMERRVSLLVDLWDQRLDDALCSALRSAGEALWRGPEVRQRAVRIMEDLGKAAPARVAAMLIDGRLWPDGEAAMVQPEVLELLRTRQRGKHLVAFHPNNTDPKVAVEFLRDRRQLESVDVVLYDQPLSPDVAAAVRAELTTTRLLKHTHSRVECTNLLAISYALCETDPTAGALLAQAYASWTRCHHGRSGGGHSFIWQNRNVQIDRATVEKLYQRQVEYGRRLAEAYAESRGEPVERDRWVHDYMLEAVLERQESAGERMRDTLRESLATHGIKYRSKSGTLVVGRTRLADRDASVEEVRSMFEDATREPRWPQVAAGLLAQAALTAPDRQILDGYISAFRDVATETISARPFFGAATARTTVDQGAETAELLFRVRRGELSLEEIGAVSYSNRVFAAAWDQAVRMPRHVREAVIGYTADIDVAYTGWVLEGEVDVVTALGLDRTSADLQLRMLLDGRDEVEWPKRPKRWDDLPTAEFLPWNIAPVAKDFAGKEVSTTDGTYHVRVLSNIGELRANAAPNCMGNCTETYAPRIRRGNTVILALERDGRTAVNISLEPAGGGRWEVTEMKGPHNRVLNPAVAAEITAQLRELSPAIEVSGSPHL